MVLKMVVMFLTWRVIAIAGTWSKSEDREYTPQVGA